MSRLLFISLLMLQQLLGFSQSKIIGEVVYMNSNSTPAVGVHITAKGSNGAYSKSDGSFVLIFPYLEVGTTVYPNIENEIVLNDVTTQIEIVNSEELKWINIPKNPNQEKLKIIVCPRGYRDDLAKKYYGIIRTESDRQLELKKQEIEELTKKLGEYNSLVLEKQEELERYYQQSDSLSIYNEAMELASINKDDASERVKNYLEALDAGLNIEEARKELSTEKAYLEAKSAEDKIEKSLEEMKLEAENYKMQQNYEQALNIYDTVITLLSGDLYNPKLQADYLFYAGRLCQDQRIDSTSIEYFLEALDAIKNDKYCLLLRAEIINSLGNLYRLDDQLDKAKEAFKTAIEIADCSEEDSLEYYIIYKAMSTHNLGASYYLQGKHEDAKLNYLAAIEGYHAISPANSERYDSDISMWYGNLGLLLLDMGDYSSAEYYLNESLQIRKELYAKDSLANSWNLAIIYKNLGRLNFFYHKDTAKAEECHLESLDLIESVFDYNPQRYATAKVYFNQELGLFYINLGNPALAKDYFLNAIEILTTENIPSEYIRARETARLEKRMAALYINKGDYKNGQKHYMNSLREYEELYNLRPKQYVRHLGQINVDLGILLLNIGELDSSLKHLQEALNYYSDPVIELNYHDISVTNIYLGTCFQKKGDYLAAVNHFERALHFYNWCKNNNKDFGELEKAVVEMETGIMYMSFGNTYKADSLLSKSSYYFRALSETGDSTYDNIFGVVLMTHGALGIELEEFEKAKLLLDEGLGILENLNKKNEDLYVHELLIGRSIMGHYYFASGELLKAEELYQKGIELYKIIDENQEDVEIALSMYFLLGGIYWEKFQSEKKQEFKLKGLEFIQLGRETLLDLSTWNGEVKSKYINSFNELEADFMNIE